jgi:HAD superfamily hydrolase (TIGR01509 family)
MPLQLVILDCDGVLVDSEHLAHEVLVEVVAELGLSLSVAEALRLFQGGKMADCLSALQERLGRALPEGFESHLRARTAERFRKDLRPVPGVVAALDRIKLPYCVATSGPRAKVELSLTLTGLLDRFQGRIFSGYEVGSWKPDPGLFLHAARALGADPAACAVVEDSLPGIQAGIAAGMYVFAYRPDGLATELEGRGVRVFRAMEQLPGLLARMA